MLAEELKKYNIILASKSPRRKQLLGAAGISFKLADDRNVDEEIIPSNLSKYEIPVYLSEKKSNVYTDLLLENTIIITADTIVWFKGEVLGKPADKTEAVNILKRLSGNTHEVITGVTIRNANKKKSFYSHSEVVFAELNEEEIEYYVDTYKPFDKAGSYGIQEWIGYIGVEEVRGSFLNIIGLPVHKLYRELEEFIKKT